MAQIEFFGKRLYCPAVFLFAMLSMVSNLAASSVDVQSFGAKGDGVTDDKEAIQRAISAAQENGESLLFPKGTYLLKSGLIIEKDLKILAKNGATLKPFGIFTVLSINRGSTEISGIAIDADNQVNGSGMTGIRIAPKVNVQIENIKLINWRHGSGIRFYAPNGEPHGSILLNRITIVGAPPVSKNISPVRWYPISIERVSNNSLQSPNQPNSQVRIQNCKLQGGYYGINLIGISKALVSNNKISGVMRGISLQRNCTNNTVSKNTILDCKSSGILVGYNSNQNAVFRNSVVSSTWIAEALIKISVNCNDNLISKNHLDSKVLQNPGENFINVSLMSNRTTISKNTLIGCSRKPAIAIESSWDNKTKDKNQFGYGKSVDLSGLDKGPIDGITLFKNDLRRVCGVRGDQPLIFVSEGSRKSGRSVTGLNLKRNKLPKSTHAETAVRHSRGKDQLQKTTTL